MKRLRLGCLELLFIALIALTAAARVVDAWPASSHEIEALSALAASNGAARSFVAASLSAQGSPSRKQVRRWRGRVVAIEDAATRAGRNASGQTVQGSAHEAQIGTEH